MSKKKSAKGAAEQVRQHSRESVNYESVLGACRPQNSTVTLEDWDSAITLAKDVLFKTLSEDDIAANPYHAQELAKVVNGRLGTFIPLRFNTKRLFFLRKNQ